VKFSRTGRNELSRSHRSVVFIIATNDERLRRYRLRVNRRTSCGRSEDFFYLSWYFVRALFKSEEFLERENAELRRQLEASKAQVEAEQPAEAAKAKEGAKKAEA